MGTGRALLSMALSMGHSQTSRLIIIFLMKVAIWIYLVFHQIGSAAGTRLLVHILKVASIFPFVLPGICILGVTFHYIYIICNYIIMKLHNYGIIIICKSVKKNMIFSTENPDIPWINPESIQISYPRAIPLYRHTSYRHIW